MPPPDMPPPLFQSLGFSALAYRTIDQERMIQHLMHWGFAHDIRERNPETARIASEQALKRWIELGLKHAYSETAGCLFDPVEVMNFFILAGVQGKDNFWQENYVRTARRFVSDLHGESASPDDVPSPIRLGPRKFRIRLERDYDLSGLAPGTRVRLRLPLPIADHALRDLTMEIHVPDGSVTSMHTGRLDVIRTVDEQTQVTLGVEADFEAHTGLNGDTRELTPAEHLLYTNPREGMICVTDRIRSMAGEIVEASSDCLSKANSIHSFLLENFYMGNVPYHEVDAKNPTGYPFLSGGYDCQIGSALFCALCRAAGVPARIVSGYYLYPANAAHHYWAEVWAESGGWSSFDLSPWHLSLAGQDRNWRDIFSGTLDYRMRVQAMPGIFTGPSTIKFPAAWHMLNRALGSALETSYEDAVSGALIYRDRLSILGNAHPRRPDTSPPRQACPQPS